MYLRYLDPELVKWLSELADKKLPERKNRLSKTLENIMRFAKENPDLYDNWQKTKARILALENKPYLFKEDEKKQSS